MTEIERESSRRVPRFFAAMGLRCHRLRGSVAVAWEARQEGGTSMRILIACAIIISAAVGLGGCWGHHEKAVVQEPLKLG